MSRNQHSEAVLMIAYTNYRSDPRVMREAEAAVHGGFDVDFLALRRKEDPAVENMRGVTLYHLNQARYRGKGRVRYLLAYLEFFVRCFFKSASLHFRKRYRVIHVNNMPDFLVFCTLIPKLFGAKILLDIHDPMPNTFASKFKKGDRGLFYRLLLWQERLSSWYADQTITVHEPLKRDILSQHGLRTENISTVINCADDELFHPTSSYAINGQVRLVFHGTILERSGLRNLVLALSKVKHRDKLRVLIVGEGDFSAELEALIEKHGIRDFVRYDNHNYAVFELPKLLNDYHIGLVTLEISSLTNYVLPLKLMEYISLALPIITVRNAAISHYLGEDDCLFYQSDDVESLRRVMDQVAEDPAIALRCRERMLAVRERFLWSKEREKYIALIRGLAGRPAVASSEVGETSSLRNHG